MTGGERVLDPQLEFFQYLWSLADPGPQKFIRIPSDAPKYSVVLCRLINDSDGSPAALDVGIRDLSDDSRLLEAYHLEPSGISQLQCQIPPLTGIPYPSDRRDGQVWIETSTSPSLERAAIVAEFISSQNP